METRSNGTRTYLADAESDGADSQSPFQIANKYGESHTPNHHRMFGGTQEHQLNGKHRSLSGGAVSDRSRGSNQLYLKTKDLR